MRLAVVRFCIVGLILWVLIAAASNARTSAELWRTAKVVSKAIESGHDIQTDLFLAPERYRAEGVRMPFGKPVLALLVGPGCRGCEEAAKSWESYRAGSLSGPLDFWVAELVDDRTNEPDPEIGSSTPGRHRVDLEEFVLRSGIVMVPSAILSSSEGRLLAYVAGVPTGEDLQALERARTSLSGPAYSAIHGTAVPLEALARPEFAREKS